MRLSTAIFVIASVLPVSAFAGGLEHVKQTIYGMDCAPCAYGVEKGLKGLNGVEQVKVSLNDGYADVHLGEDSQATLAEIREVIRKNGFTPKTADVHVSGTVVASNGQFALKTDVSAMKVTGSVAADDDQALSVTAIH